MRSEAATWLLTKQLGKPIAGSVYFGRLRIAGWARKQSSKQLSVKDADHSLEQARKTDFSNEILEPLAKVLSEVELLALMLHAIDDKNFVEIGDDLGMTRNGALKAYNRAVKKARKEIEQ